MNESFFGKNGTLNQLINVTNDIRSMQSNSSMDRLGGLGRLVQFVMSLFA